MNKNRLRRMPFDIYSNIAMRKRIKLKSVLKTIWWYRIIQNKFYEEGC